MAAVAHPPPPDKALTTEPALHDSPSHASMEPDPQAPRPVPFPRQSDADAPVGGGAGSGSKQPIESPPAPGSGAPSPPRSAASPAASVGHSAGGHTPGPLDESRYLEPTLPPQAGHPRRIKDDDLPPLPTSESEVSLSNPSLFRRITKRLLPVVSPVEHSDAPPTSFQISLPTRSRSRSRSRARDSSSGADAPQPQIGKQRRPHVRIPVVPRAPAPAPLPNSFTSAENRRAALRARGLVPTSAKVPRYRDANGFWIPLSEQEKELDRMFAVVVEEKRSPENEDTEAKKFRDAWLAKHRAESELDLRHEDDAAGASPSLDAHLSASAVYENGSRSALPSTVNLAHPSAAPAEPNRHARRPSGDGALRGRAFAASASADNFRPDLMPAVDPSLPEMPFEETAAHRLPRARDRRSSDVSERVSRWFQTSLRPRSASASRPASAGEGARFGLFSRRRSIDASIVPTPYRKESDARRSADVSGWVPSARASMDDVAHGTQSMGRRTPARKLPPAPPSAFTPIKTKHDAAVIITTSPTDASPTSPAPAVSISQSNTSRTSLEHTDDSQNLRVRRVQMSHRRGRSTTISDPQQQSATPGTNNFASSSSLALRSHSRTMPALSPTRSASSSEMGLPATPTTDTHGCEPPPPPPREHHRPGSSSGRSQSQLTHEHPPAKQASLSRSKTMARPAHPPPGPPPAAHGGAARDDASTESDFGSSYVEVEVDMEFGVRMQSEAQKMRDLMAAAATAGGRARPRRESADDPERRRSMIGLFAKKEEVDAPPKFKNPRATSSMQNMKRTVTGTLASLKPRPKTIVEDSTLGEAPHSATAPASPPSVYAPPTSFPQAMAAPKRRNASVTRDQSFSPTRSSVGSGPRPRQALSPTIHDRGTILVEAGRIEDEESRRLSEMAFLDY